jgi:antitoxin YefM
MKTMTVKAAQEDLGSIVEAVSKHGEPVVIHRENGHSAVVISLEDFKDMDETEYLLSSPENARRLLAAIEDHKKGVNLRERELIDP